MNLAPRVSPSTTQHTLFEGVFRQASAAIERLSLRLSGFTVLTEAATGHYAVTAPIAALAGAKRVYAVARDSHYGTVADAFAATESIAKSFGVQDRIVYLDGVPEDLTGVDILTNSGHLRPLDGTLLSKLRENCVIALMYEAWELRNGDIAIEECRRRGIRVTGVNERHPAVDVFPFLGPLCIKLLMSAGLPIYSNKIAVCCDNEFSPYILASLSGLGAQVQHFNTLDELERGDWQCIVFAQKPVVRVGRAAAERIRRLAPGATFAQFWGDLDRDAFAAAGIEVFPHQCPKPGHMAILLSELGSEPIVRLQAGGLKAAEIVARGAADICNVAQVIV